MKLNENMEQLRALVSRPSELQVAIYGKYNHGKSSLLNALVGEEVFKTADIRETVKMQSHSQNGIRWIDTPGLDADVEENDDKIANELLTSSDLLLFVHSVNEGELDNKELTFLKEQYEKNRNTILVLTQIDKTENLNNVQKAIEKQLSFMTKPIEIIASSAKRASHDKKEIREQGNMDSIINKIKGNKQSIIKRRKKEKITLKNILQEEIESKLEELNKNKSKLLSSISQLENDFLDDVINVKEHQNY